MLELSVRDEIAGILSERDLETKLRAAERLTAARSKIASRVDSGDPLPVARPGRPDHWRVVEPEQVPRRSGLGSAAGRFGLMHSVAHIELSAIELALMAVADFPDEPAAYHRDMLRVAADECRHTRMLMARLQSLGGELGDEPVHHGLYDTAVGFGGLLDRLAVVPRILEARGLDVSAGLRDRLAKAGDHGSAEDLAVIYRDEIGHVAVGSKWYRRAAARHGVDVRLHFARLLERFRPRRPGPVDESGRRRAGFDEEEIALLRGRV